MTNIKQVKCILNHMFFHLIVKWGVRRKTRTLIYLNEPRSKVLIYHNIEAQDLKAHGIVQALRLADTVHVVHVGLSTYNSLDDDVLDLCHDLVRISSLRQQDLQDCRQASLMTFFFISVVIFIVIIVTILIFFFSLLIILLKFVI